jgi:hypothetical protein
MEDEIRHFGAALFWFACPTQSGANMAEGRHDARGAAPRLNIG